MRRLVRALLMTALGVALLGAPPVAATEHDDEVVRERTLDIRFIVRSGAWGEINMEMRENARIEYSIRVTDNRHIHLDLHSHVPMDECQAPAMWDATMGACYHFGPIETRTESSTFIASRDGAYSFLMERRDERDVTVLATIRGEFGIDSIEGIDPIESTPAPGLITVLAALGLLTAVAARRGRHA